MTLGLAIVASLGLTVQAVPGTVGGVVRGAGDGQPLVAARIELVGTGQTTTTDADGRYVLLDVPPGEQRLKASRFGFSPLFVELSIPESGAVAVDFHLRVKAFLMPPVTVVDRRAIHVEDPELVNGEPAVPAHAAVRVLDTSPGVTELGISTGAQALLGPDPPSPDNVLYVRGAGASLDLVLLDGAPVHAPFNLGGLVEPGLPPSIQRAERMQGGLTARYDGGLADVLLLTSRPGAEGAGAGLFADMLAAGGHFESASKDIGAVYLSYRSLHNSWKGAVLNSGLPQRYSDALVRTDLFLGTEDTLSATLFHNEETVRLDGDSGVDEPRWGNTAGSVRYLARTAIGRMELGSALGDFRTRLPVGSTDPLTATGRTRRARLWADFSSRIGGTEIGYGLHGDLLNLRTRFKETAPADDTLRLTQRASAGGIGAWFEGRRAIGPRVDLKAGLRANFLTDGMGSSLSPRLHLGWQVARDWRVTGSMGRFHQMVVTLDTELPVETTAIAGSDGRILGSILSDVAAARSTHLLLGVTHAPTPRELLRFEAFWKSSSGVPEYGNGALRNVGIDLLLGRPLTPRVSMWAAYSLAWAWAAFPDAASQDVYSARHFLRGGLTVETVDRLRLDADLSFGRGLEFGAIPRSERASLTTGTAGGAETPLPTAPASPVSPGPQSVVVPVETGGPIFTRAPNGSYLRLNFQVTGEFDVRFFGRDQKLLPYFRLVNALDREDALFFRFDGEEDSEPKPIGSVPVLPIIGLEWRL
jgi:hypothetical protein